MSHEPLGFLSGTFRGSQQRRATVDKEGFAIVTTFRRWEYLLWGGVRIDTDQRNLAYIFEPEAYVPSAPKTSAQRLDNWKMVLAQYDYMTMHISDERNCWEDLSSLWVNVPAVAVRLSRCSRAVRRMRLCRRRMQFVRYSSRLGLAWAPWLAAPLRSLLRLAARRGTSRICFAWGWMVETCCGSRNKRRKCRRGSWCALT